MRFKWIKTAIIGAALTVVAAAASCGGGGHQSLSSGNPQQGSGTLPGVVGNQGGAAGAGQTSNGQSSPITASGQAPLGLNQTYKPQIATGTAEYQDTRGSSSVKLQPQTFPARQAVPVTTFTAGKGASLIGGGTDPGFTIIDLTMVPTGVSPTWAVVHPQFTEGAQVDLWVKYQMLDHSMVLARHWNSADIGLNQTDSNLTTPQGTYTVKLPWTIPYGSRKNNAVFKYDLTGNGVNKVSANFLFDILVPTSGFDVVDLTMMPDGVAADWNLTHAQFHEGDKIDLWIKYELYSNSMTMDRHWLATDLGLDYNEFAIPHTKGVYSVKLDYAIPYVGAKSNSVFKFDVTGNGVNKVSSPFTFDVLTSAGATNVVYPPAGIPSNGDNSVPGYGAGWAQFTVEDLISNSDYDFNDFAGRMQATEYRNSTGNLSQIKIRLKAVARGAGYAATWQMNINSAFPGATCWAKVDQYYANGTRHGNEVIWQSSNGTAVPVFSPTTSALPPPPQSFATNTVAGSNYVDGDYADVTIFFNAPVLAGTYTPIPYQPELRVQPPSSPLYIVTCSTLSSNGWSLGSTLNGNPLAFMVPETWAWPMEYQAVWNCYPGFLAWGTWALAPNSGNTHDPNTYLASPAPTTSGSQFNGTPQLRTYWTGASGQTEFHQASPAGQLGTLALIQYLNGDGTQTNNSISKVVLNPLKVTVGYFGSSLPLPTTSINNVAHTSNGYTRLKSYMNGATSGTVITYQLGAELAALVLNVERGHISPTEWTFIPEYGQIRAVVGDPLITTQTGVIAAANAAFALPAGAANDATRTIWFHVCQRLNANTYFVQNQPKPEPLPHWYDTAPTGSYFKRSLFN